MTDPGWAIPGVPRGAAPAASHDRGRRRPTMSASARANPSAGSYARAGSAAVTAPGSASSLASPPAASVPDDARYASAGGDVATADSSGPPTTLEARDPSEALAFLRAGLDYLAHADPAEWSAGLQADCLRALAIAEAQHAAAHANVLAAFSVPGGGLAADGHRSARTWLTWQTRATRRAATVHVARMRELKAHPLIAAALAGGMLPVSWARQLADWSGQLPAEHRGDADAQFLAAANSGASLADLFYIFAELRRQHAAPDGDARDGFDDRAVRFATTFGGAGRIDGDLTPRCAAAVDAVLGSLSAKLGPEDIRTLGQRQHDALEEACTRLLAASCLPERAGQPVRLELNITLDQFTANGDSSPAGPGACCDAAIQPVLTGTVDHDLLDRLARTGPSTGTGPEPAQEIGALGAGDQARRILEQAIALLSGPAGTAARLRRQLSGPAAAISLPLDIAGTTDTIPVHLRRAVRTRDQHCRFPGCDLPPAACDVHHLQHRKDGGRHALNNLALFCRFHHLVAIHRWGWQITLRPDGTTTAVSPDGGKTLHSHPPPDLAA